jgi:hypothetical protein
MECFAVVYLDLRARRSGVWLEGDSPMVDELLFLSHVVGVVVCCVVCVVLVQGWCLCGGVCFDVLCTI